jgi:hypothetical protein
MDRSIVHLQRARDALTCGFGLLERASERGGGARSRHAQAARGILAEAVLSLARAAVHVPGLRTCTTDVIFAENPNVTLELRRLHQIATQLWWENSPRFPTKWAASRRDDARLDELMTSYVSADERATLVAKTAAGAALLAVGAAVSPTITLFCCAAVGVRGMLRS